jgi:hypothetical protein
VAAHRGHHERLRPGLLQDLDQRGDDLPDFRYAPAPYADGHGARRQLHGLQRPADALVDAREGWRGIYPVSDERDARESDGAQYLSYLLVDRVLRLHRFTSVVIVTATARIPG